MPIPLPNLDDRDFAQLTAQARALIPTVGPEWTNHNAADPGITLVELLAWLTEMLLFQVNEVTPQHTEKFLGLLNEPGWAGTGTAGLTEATRATILALRERYRAVTAEDYEDLTRAWSGTEPAAALGGIQRVHCIPRRDLTAADPLVRGAPAPGHVSVVIVPVPVPGADDPQPRPTPELCAALWEFLDGRRTLTTHHHVIAPNYVPVEFGADLAPSEGVRPDQALAAARAALTAFFDPLTGGPDGTGWPFGRAVHVSEVYAVLEHPPEVDYVEAVTVATSAGDERIRTGADGRPVGVVLDAHELVHPLPTGLVAYDATGVRHT